MIALSEFQLASEILSYLEDIPDIDRAKSFVQIYIGLTNHRLTKEGYDSVETRAVLKFIVQVDQRLGNMV